MTRTIFDPDSMPDVSLSLISILLIMDATYLVRCVLDCTLVAFKDDNNMLETRPKYIAKRFIQYRVLT